MKSWIKGTKHCVLAATGNDNTNDNPNDISFTMKSTKLYVSFMTLSERDNQKLWKLLTKVFEISVYSSEYKTKWVRIKKQQIKNQVLLALTDYLY